jgi:choline kinase
LERQVAAARAVGLNEISVITGYKPETVDRVAAGLKVDTIWNPLSEFTENIVSLAIVRNFDSDVVIINGDVLFPREFLKLMLDSKDSTLLIDKWANDYYDAEAMKVSIRSEWITSISKEIPMKKAKGEYIGICKIRRRDMSLVRGALNQLLSSKALWFWYEAAFNLMVRHRRVFKSTFLPTECSWTEIDTPQDYERALSVL